MATDKKSVVLYCDIIHTVKELTDEEAGRLFKHYLAYINDLNPIPPDKLTQVIFEPIKQSLKRDLKKWEDKRGKRSDAGKKGMEKRWGNNNNVITNITNDNNVIENITNITVSDSVSVSDSVNVSDIIIEQKTFDLTVGQSESLKMKFPILKQIPISELLDKFNFHLVGQSKSHDKQTEYVKHLFNWVGTASGQTAINELQTKHKAEVLPSNWENMNTQQRRLWRENQLNKTKK